MTLDELKTDLDWLLQDRTVNAAFDRLIASERLSFAAEYELPALKLYEPVSVAVTTATWLYDMPATYHKMVFRARNNDPNEYWFPCIYREIAAIDALDFDHNETDTYVQQIAVEGNKLAVYPKANDSIKLWYFKKPDTSAAITEIPDEWIPKVLTPRLVLRAFRLFPELAREASTENRLSLDYWRTRQMEGLYGSPHTGEIGFINTLSKSRPPRRHGGRQPL